MNCINIGLIADVMNLRRQAHSLLGSRTLSFIVSIFLMIFHRMDYKMHVRINSDEVTLLKVPIACKIVEYTIGNDTQSYRIAHLFFFLHQTVDSIVQRRVATHDDNGFIAVMLQSPKPPRL